eukprot:TRINITY_DN496_c0_g1_i1.p1 TRINITY_DN496_c0_g1~~TRINITY_DN496_c0_g1_i1.p1  ORF type:complete len:192 (+),score=65.01 TRINITY_DN496_c0_g1_i1:57-632(+)
MSKNRSADAPVTAKRSSDAANPEVVEVVSDISKKIDDFMVAVAQLKDLEEKPDRIRDEVANAEREKHARMAEFDRKMIEHEMMTIQNVLQKQNKVAIDIDELKELQALQVREDAESRQIKRTKFESDVDEKVKTELKLKEFQYAKKFAEATAKETSFKTEKEMLYLTISGLKEEIESQKKLTSDLALSSRQ